MSTFDDFMIGQAVSKDSEIHALIQERNSYREAFKASLKWLDRDVHADAMCDTPKDATFSDEYKMDLDDIRGARRRLGL